MLAVSAIGAAHAGSFDNGQWASTRCGPRPEAPALNLKDADAYNASIEGVTTWRRTIQTWLNCQTDEANADIQLITRAATAARQAVQDANAKIQADVKTAEEKFK